MYHVEHSWHDDQYVIWFKYTINLFLITDFYYKGDVTARKEALVVVWLLQDSQNLNINENTYDNTNITKHMKMCQIRFIHATQF
jgi:hypothetical protein